MGRAQKHPGRQIGPRLTRKKFFTYMPLYLMALPGVAYLFINNYMPLPGLVVAFKQYDARLGIYGSPWAGFKNFEYLFKTSDAWIITRNTLLYNVAFIIVNLVFAITIAILLSELDGKLKKVYQSSILLPFLISTVIIGYLVFAFLGAENGFINRTILPLLGKDKINWYSEPRYWPFILTLVNLWRSVGYNCIIYLSVIIGIDKGYYEAASIEGASRLKRIRYITLPLLRPTVILLVLISVGRIFYSDFGLFYQVPMNQGALFSTTNTIDTYVYRGLVQLGNISMSAAAGVYQSLVGFILVLGSNLLVRKVDKESALF